MPEPGGRAARPAGRPARDRQACLLVLDNFEQVSDAAPQVGELLARAARGSGAGHQPQRRCASTASRSTRCRRSALPDPSTLPDLETLVAVRRRWRCSSSAPWRCGPASRVDRRERPGRRRDLRPARRPAAGDRAGRGARQAAHARRRSWRGWTTGWPARRRRRATCRSASRRCAARSRWSHDLLERGRSRVFARLAVFAGGADLDAVEQVVIADWPADVGPAPMPSTRSPRCSTRACCARRWSDGGEPRFRMLQTIRAFGMEHLDEREPEAETRAPPRRPFLAAGRAGWSGTVFGAEQRAALDCFERSTTTCAPPWLRHRDGPTADAPCACWPRCWRFWQMRGYLPEARDKANRILQLKGSRSEVRLKALRRRRRHCLLAGRHAAAREWYEKEGGAGRRAR